MEVGSKIRNNLLIKYTVHGAYLFERCLRHDFCADQVQIAADQKTVLLVQRVKAVEYGGQVSYIYRGSDRTPLFGFFKVQGDEVVGEYGTDHLCLVALVLVDAVGGDPDQVLFRQTDVFSVYEYIGSALFAVEQFVVFVDVRFHIPAIVEAAAEIEASVEVFRLVFQTASPNLLATLCRLLARLSRIKAI